MNQNKSIEEFYNNACENLNNLFNDAKKKDEGAYVFALLGLNSGSQDEGWEPISETLALFDDVMSIINIPLEQPTKIRLLLLLYCQITETSHLYHVIFNMLAVLEGETPKIFNFLNLYRQAIPPSVKFKKQKISEKAENLRYKEIKAMLNDIFDEEVRNAVSHADYILHGEYFRLKHKGIPSQKKIGDIVLTINKAATFFKLFFDVINKHKRSYKDGYVISNRKSKEGNNLSSIKVQTSQDGVIIGISASDPLPIW